MSRRFGRNQRRRAREALAATQAEASRWHTAYDMTLGLSQDLGKTVRKLLAELAEAKEIAGRMSILFPVNGEPLEVNMAAEDALRHGARVVVESWTAFDLPASLSTVPLSTVPLEVLLADVERKALDNSIHAHVRFKGMHVAYGINEYAWRSLGTRQREHLLTIEIHRQLARQLVKELKA